MLFGGKLKRGVKNSGSILVAIANPMPICDTIPKPSCSSSEKNVFVFYFFQHHFFDLKV